MLDILHKILYTGIGFAVMTEQKAAEIVAELEKRGEVNSEESKKLAQELVDKARQQGKEFREAVSKEVDRVADKFKWVSRQEFEELKSRVEKLEGASQDTSC